MKRFIRKTIAATAAAAMVITLVPASALAATDTSGTINGSADLEGYLNKHVYDIVVPTVSSLELTADPQGLLTTADPSAFTGGEGSVYFANANEGGDPTYSDKSDDITIYNKSSYAIDVSLSVTVNTSSGESSSGVSLATKEALADVESPSIYLGLITDEGTPVAITSTTAYDSPSTTLDAVEEVNGTSVTKGYKVNASTTEVTGVTQSPMGYYYTYELTSGFADTDADNVTYNLEAACDSVADWSSVDASKLSASIVWTASEHVDGTLTEANASGLTYDIYADASNDLTVASYTGYDASKIFAYNGETLLESGDFVAADGSVKITKEYLAGLADESINTFNVVYDADGDVETTEDQVTVSQAVTIDDTTPAPVTDDYIMVKSGTDVTYTFIDKPTGTLTDASVKFESGTDTPRTGQVTAGNITYNAETGIVTLNSAALTTCAISAPGTYKITLTIGGVAKTLTYVIS